MYVNVLKFDFSVFSLMYVIWFRVNAIVCWYLDGLNSIHETVLRALILRLKSTGSGGNFIWKKMVSMSQNI